MRIAVAADEMAGVAGVLLVELRRRGHEVSPHGALLALAERPVADGAGAGGGRASDGAGLASDGAGLASAAEARSGVATEREGWAWCSEAAAREVAEGRAEQAVVCCWTGTGASIAANKVAGVRAALCADAATAAGARRWNDANVLALSLRSTSEAELSEILDAWFAGAASDEGEDRENVAHLAEIENQE